ncbi:MAG: hypothetical protein M5U07_13080 [Xanthobacteraceae bacterium]|nr:hypothetical protein [Xanthobacteraceae bacterium]
MTLANRVDPFGALHATPTRGLFLGNRGGRFHRSDLTLGRRRWASKQWICCRLAFKDRRRAVWRTGYTELFFLDEPTALAAGHRPCFECRRAEARAFAAAWARAQGLGAPPRAPEMDAVLHAERRDRAARRARLADLPDGVFVTLPDDAAAFALHGGTLWRWSPAGYAAARLARRATEAVVLTPPSIVAALAAGYAPHWHPSVLASPPREGVAK